ncbi:unnamed protein product [Amoebophrya sp. A25]|nr:unnamed protein product [Amoebophrya sp. A25]|eukprot:GSA25T00021539001.1
MGVLAQSGAWVQAKGISAADSVKGNVVSELERCQNAIKSLMQVAPAFPAEMVEKAVASVQLVISKIQEVEAVQWSKEKTFTLYSTLIEALESVLTTLSPFFTTPTLYVRDQLTAVIAALKAFVSVTFGKLDDGIVTPAVTFTVDTTGYAYSTAKDVTVSKYNMVKDTVVIPAATCVNTSIVTPVVATTKDVATKTSTKAIETAGWLDTKLSLVNMMAAVVERSKKLDACVANGAIETKVVRPAFETAASLDSKYLNGKSQEILATTITQFNDARGVPQVAAVAPPTTKTSAGAPTMKGNRQYRPVVQ